MNMEIALVLPKITKDTPGSGDGQWIPWKWARAVIPYLEARDCWPDETHTKITYNPCYHFYDLSVFPHPGNKGDTAESVGLAVVEAFTTKFNRAEDQGHTWRWVRGETKNLTGRRIWIYPK